MVTMREIGGRIRQSREVLGWSQARLASQVGVDRSSLSRIESGDRVVSAVELGNLAHALGRSITFFLSREEADRDILLRAENVSPSDQSLLGRFFDYCEEYASLEGIVYGEPVQGVPVYPVSARTRAIDQGEELAEAERRRLGLGYSAVRDVFAIIEGEGVKVYVEDQPDSGLMGAFHSSPVLGPCVYVNIGVRETRAAFTAAHEYCHFLVDREEIGSYACLRPGEGGSDRPLHEVRANSFAAAFLMPRKGVEALVRRYGIDGAEDVVNLQQHFGVSYEAALWRLQNLRHINDSTREGLSRAKRGAISRKLGLDEDLSLVAGGPSRAEHPGWRFRQLALEAFRKHEISGGKLAELLHLSRSEARELIAEMTGDAVAETA